LSSVLSPISRRSASALPINRAPGATFPLSPREARAGREPERGGIQKAIPPLPNPLLPPASGREGENIGRLSGSGAAGAHQVQEVISRLRRFSPGVALLACLLVAPAQAADPAAATNHYEFRTGHSRDGIGKFYMGREIAHVMGHQAADWLERPERDQEEHTETLVKDLKVRPGDVVADIGAGTGYFTRRVAGKVGPRGTILAVDIQPEMLVLLTNKMAEAGITNVKPVLGTITDPRLPPNSVDLAFMVDVYHEFDHPREMMQAIARSLKPGGRVVFVEFRGEDPAVPIKPLHKMTEAQVKKEMEALSLKWIETIHVLPRQHMIVFGKQID
jgi:ubiquinone/menaquinone biosynthesis C-methylase UbiE